MRYHIRNTQVWPPHDQVAAFIKANPHAHITTQRGLLESQLDPSVRIQVLGSGFRMASIKADIKRNLDRSEPPAPVPVNVGMSEADELRKNANEERDRASRAWAEYGVLHDRLRLWQFATCVASAIVLAVAWLYWQK